jgi:hypothetical protein
MDGWIVTWSNLSIRRYAGPRHVHTVICFVMYVKSMTLQASNQAEQTTCLSSPAQAIHIISIRSVIYTYIHSIAYSFIQWVIFQSVTYSVMHSVSHALGQLWLLVSQPFMHDRLAIQPVSLSRVNTCSLMSMQVFMSIQVLLSILSLHIYLCMSWLPVCLPACLSASLSAWLTEWTTDCMKNWLVDKPFHVWIKIISLHVGQCNIVIL